MKRRVPTELYHQVGGLGGGLPSPTIQTAGQQQRAAQRLQLNAANTMFDKAMAYRAQEREALKGLNDVAIKNSPQFSKGMTQALTMQNQA
ncbi:MAG: hypothetical protein KC476_02410 [Cyanobacteria bacterium HKST-UBA06]|nr:hypothetical protein [Cyanobacteria bacterium HKST-UBA05]MCA9798622.1 hypothetical protein [Cyanobacteria bacterium HKST-UBA04]MCA9806782.1 hypothetical protein [Cyanobacteria bacterium HKST-UBA06]MCA9841944.1 hypothetical protein [Cyanobacteria bacterium HKST-UBA03]